MADAETEKRQNTWKINLKHLARREKKFSGTTATQKIPPTNPDRDEIMVEYQKSLDLGSACQIVQQRHKQLEAQRRAAEERRARQQAQQEAEAKAKAAIEAGDSRHRKGVNPYENE